MKIKAEKAEEFSKCLEANSHDGYSLAVMNYLTRWADLMETEIAKGKKLADIAEKTSHKADTEGITGFMYGCAVNILAQVWEHGEELRKWHNKEYDYEGDGVVNPAIITINEKE